jgi:hypothetical protein
MTRPAWTTGKGPTGPCSTRSARRSGACPSAPKRLSATAARSRRCASTRSRRTATASSRRSSGGPSTRPSPTPRPGWRRACGNGTRPTRATGSRSSFASTRAPTSTGGRWFFPRTKTSLAEQAGARARRLALATCSNRARCSNRTTWAKVRHRSTCYARRRANKTRHVARRTYSSRLLNTIRWHI